MPRWPARGPDPTRQARFPSARTCRDRARDRFRQGQPGHGPCRLAAARSSREGDVPVSVARRGQQLPRRAARERERELAGRVELLETVEREPTVVGTQPADPYNLGPGRKVEQLRFLVCRTEDFEVLLFVGVDQAVLRGEQVV